MSDKIHVYNSTKSDIIVKCYKKKKKGEKQKKYSEYTINPNKSRMIRETGFFTSGESVELRITQKESIHLKNGTTKDVVIKKANFMSSINISWIVKENNIIQQLYGENLDVEDPNGRKYNWYSQMQNITLTNVKYQSLSSSEVEWKPFSYDLYYFTNPNSQSATVSNEISVQVEKSYNWSKSIGGKITVEGTVKAGIPLLVKKELKVGLEGSYAYNTGGSYSETVIGKGSYNAELPPHSQLEVTAVVQRASVSLSYTAYATIKYDDGTVESIGEIKSIYDGICGFRTEIIPGEITPIDSLNTILSTNTFTTLETGKPLELSFDSPTLNQEAIVI